MFISDSMAWSRPSDIDYETRHASGVLPRNSHSKLWSTALTSLTSLQLLLLVAVLRGKLPSLRRRVPQSAHLHARARVGSASVDREPRHDVGVDLGRRIRLLPLLALPELCELLQRLLQHTRHRALACLRSCRSLANQSHLQRPSYLHDRFCWPLLCLYAYGSVWYYNNQKQLNKYLYFFSDFNNNSFLFLCIITQCYLDCSNPLN